MSKDIYIKCPDCQGNGRFDECCGNRTPQGCCGEIISEPCGRCNTKGKILRPGVTDDEVEAYHHGY